MLVLDFERPVVELESQIKDLKEEQGVANTSILAINRIGREIAKLEKKLQKTIQEIYGDLTPWQKLQIARHKGRPNPVFLLNELFSHHIPLCGDRFYSNDNAIVCNMAKFNM